MGSVPQDVARILGPGEQVQLYIQQKIYHPKLNVDSVVLTNERIILRHPHDLRLKRDFTDFSYTDVANAILDKGLLRSTVKCQLRLGEVEYCKISDTLRDGLRGDGPSWSHATADAGRGYGRKMPQVRPDKHPRLKVLRRLRQPALARPKHVDTGPLVRITGPWWGPSWSANSRQANREHACPRLEG